MPKSNAQRCREYRQKRKERKIKIKKVPKSSTERVREFRARRKALLNVQHNISITHNNASIAHNNHLQQRNILCIKPIKKQGSRTYTVITTLSNTGKSQVVSKKRNNNEVNNIYPSKQNKSVKKYTSVRRILKGNQNGQNLHNKQKKRIITMSPHNEHIESDQTFDIQIKREETLLSDENKYRKMEFLSLNNVINQEDTRQTIIMPHLYVYVPTKQNFTSQSMAEGPQLMQMGSNVTRKETINNEIAMPQPIAHAPVKVESTLPSIPIETELMQMEQSLFNSVNKQEVIDNNEYSLPQSTRHVSVEKPTSQSIPLATNFIKIEPNHSIKEEVTEDEIVLTQPVAYAPDYIPRVCVYLKPHNSIGSMIPFTYN